MPKTNILQIRLTPENSQHLRRVAEADHLDESAWSRRAILRALETWDAGHTPADSAADTREAEQR
jgi:hypothetical protein